jgi:hypothetical protein
MAHASSSTSASLYTASCLYCCPENLFLHCTATFSVALYCFVHKDHGLNKCLYYCCTPWESVCKSAPSFAVTNAPARLRHARMSGSRTARRPAGLTSVNDHASSSLGMAAVEAEENANEKNVCVCVGGGRGSSCEHE